MSLQCQCNVQYVFHHNNIFRIEDFAPVKRLVKEQLYIAITSDNRNELVSWTFHSIKYSIKV